MTIKPYKIIFYQREDDFFIFHKKTGIAYSVLNKIKKDDLKKHKDLIIYGGPPLEHVCIAITNRCNYNCRHCYVNSPQNIDFSLKKIEEILKQLNDIGVLTITLSGGEPFIHKNIFEIIDLINKYDLVLSTIDTNGILINKKKAKKLKNYIILEPLKISVHGGSPESHNYFCRNNQAFEKLIDTLKILNEMDIDFSINTCLHYHLQDELIKMLSLFEELSAKKWTIRVIVPSGRALVSYNYFLYNTEYIINRLSDLANEYLRNNYKIILKGDIIKILIKIKQKIQLKKKEILNPCQYMKRTLYINANGDVGGCGISKIAGNIFQTNIKDIWESKEMIDIKNPKINDSCIICKFYQSAMCKPYKFICPSAPCNNIIKELLHNVLDFKIKHIP